MRQNPTVCNAHKKWSKVGKKGYLKKMYYYYSITAIINKHACEENQHKQHASKIN